MGGASTGGGGGGVGPAGVRVSKKGVKTYGTKKDAKKTSTRNETRKAVTEFVKGGGVIGAIAKGITDTVKKSKEKKVERKVNDTLIGTPDYQGDVAKKPTKVTTPVRDNDGGNNNTPTPKVKVAEIPKVNTAPTEAEVDQSSATNTTTVEEPKKVDDIYTRKRKTKARGRSMMTLTGPRGLRKDEKLTLGKPSLLGS